MTALTNFSIPKISDEEMKKRYEHIKPVVTVDGKLYHLREFTLEELSRISYYFGLKQLDEKEDVTEEVGKDELEVWDGKDFLCLHTPGGGNLFKPTPGEVLSQLKEEDLPSIAAFEILGLTGVNSRYHVSTVRLYRAKG